MVCYPFIVCVYALKKTSGGIEDLPLICGVWAFVCLMVEQSACHCLIYFILVESPFYT